MRFEISKINKIKLIIWDLDETFWKGTISDNATQVLPVPENCNLVKTLSERGIVNSICSKNDLDTAKKKLLEFGVLDYFVFVSIDWQPKGSRIKNIISDMALRPENVLFIDDNESNLAEAEFVVPEILVASPDCIPLLCENAAIIGKDDKELSRLKQYKILENKRDDSKLCENNEEFLKNSCIKVQISPMNCSVLDRVEELIQRSNQLNFTKKRITKSELEAIVEEKEYDTGYVVVSDNYGQYGIVGFYALKNNKLEHFLFSCRTMGMGIEQYVYAYLGYPDLEIIQPVSGYVSKKDGMPSYIELVDKINCVNKKTNQTKRILLKGPCDLEVMASYLENGDYELLKEFNYIDSRGNQADFFNHSVNILNSFEKGDYWKDQITNTFTFLDRNAFESRILKEQFDVICLSPLMDATLSVYQNNDDKSLLAYGLYNKPLTDSQYNKDYLEKRIMTAGSNFSQSEIDNFRNCFTKVDYTPQSVAQNYKRIVDSIIKRNNNTLIIIITLSELPCQSGIKANTCFIDKHLIHIEINKALKQTFEDYLQVQFLDVNKFIKEQSDYFDNINHYSKMVYYKMADEFSRIINENNIEVPIKSMYRAFFDNIKRSLYKLLFVK